MNIDFQILEFTHESNGSRFYIANNGMYYTPDIPGLLKSLEELVTMDKYFISSFRRSRDGQLFNAGDLIYGHYPGGKAYYIKNNPGKIKKFIFSAGKFYANFGDAYVIGFDNLIKI